MNKANSDTLASFKFATDRCVNHSLCSNAASNGVNILKTVTILITKPSTQNTQNSTERIYMLIFTI